MKKLVFLLVVAVVFNIESSQAQFWKDVKEAVEESVPELNASSLTEGEIGNGLKEALVKGVDKGVNQLSQPDGYFKDLAIKILMPEEAQKAEQMLRKMGMDKQVDDAVEAMNRAAELAAEGAKDIFLVAIKEMTFQDAMNILKGENDAATQYLNKATRSALTEKFEPVIKTSLEKVNATKYWNTVISTYNKVPLVKKLNPDLEDYVTDKALDGLFVQVAKQEVEIRKKSRRKNNRFIEKSFC